MGARLRGRATHRELAGEHLVQVACAAHEVKNSLTVLRGLGTYAAAGRLGMLSPDDEAALARLLAGVDQVLAVVQAVMEAAALAGPGGGALAGIEGESLGG